MSKTRIAKVGGFVGTLVAGAALVGTAATGTGAYFTDSHDGSMSASSGALKIVTSDANLSFLGLNPGEDKSQQVKYYVDGSSTTRADVWLVFDPANSAVANFSGATGLGRYGHFKLSAEQGRTFESYNLAKGSGAGCTTDGDGLGGSTQRPGSASETIPWCGVPDAIKIDANVGSDNGMRTATIDFGITGRYTKQNDDVLPGGVPFKIVATQVGHAPDAANF